MSPTSEGARKPAQLAVLLGKADDIRAVVYVRLLVSPFPGPVIVSGRLVGPRCVHSRTLPSTAALSPLAATKDPVGWPTAEAVLLEPGFWTPQLPHRYRLDVEVQGEGRPPLAVSTMVGLRRLGSRAGSFRLDGRRYVPRAILTRPDEPSSVREISAFLSTARAAAACVWVSLPKAQLCEAADAEGVMLLAELPPGLSESEAHAEVEKFGLHPSVGFLVVHEPLKCSVSRWRHRGTMQIGLTVDACRPPPESIDGIDFLVLDLPPAALPHPAWRAATPWPRVVRRPCPTGDEGAVAERRQECDRLQSELAAWLAIDGAVTWEPAGYAA